MFRRYLSALLSGVALLSLAACAPSARQVEGPTFRDTPLKGDPQIVFTTSNDLLLIDITSPTGIGGATIDKTSGQWPPKIVMRLHLKGLEDFKFKYGAKTVEISVSSQNTRLVREELVQDGQVGPLSAGDAYWMNVTANPDYFDIEAPADFLTSGENTFTIEWIDFYR
jgi:hypothetical protein